MTINRVAPVSLARVAGAVYAVLGLLIGVVASLFTLVGLVISSTQHAGAQSALSPVIGIGIATGAIVACPILYGVLAFLFALIGAWLYNLVAARVGGIEIELA